MVEQSIPTSIGGYVPLRIIGVGASGVVYLAREKLRENNFKAVKVLHHHTLHPDAKRQLALADITRRELDGIRQYVNIGRGHPGIIQIDDAGESDGILYYAMELADSANSPPDTSHLLSPQELEAYSPLTLEVIMKRCPVMPPRQALDIVKTMLQALKHLHDQQLIHRDVKPTNIVFVNGQPKLCDFGLLTRMDRDVTQVGTPGYLPNDTVLDQTADLYALGTVLYEMLSGLPRSAYPKCDRRNQLRGLDRIAFDAALQVMIQARQQDKSRRFQSAGEMLEAIRSRIEPHARMRRRIKWATVIILTAAIIWTALTSVPWKSLPLQLGSVPPVIPVHLNCSDSDLRSIRIYYDDGNSRQIRFPYEVEGAVVSDFIDGRPAIVIGTKTGTPDYGKLVIMHHSAPTSSSELLRTYADLPQSVPPKAWDFQEHPLAFQVRPLTAGDLDPSIGNELLVALNHDDGPAELVMLGRGGKRLGSFWHFGWFTGSWLCDLDRDGTNEIVCQTISNRREAKMGKGRIMESLHNGMMILTADLIRASSGYWGMNEWLSAGSPISPLAYGYCPFPISGDDERYQYWQLSREQLPCLSGSTSTQIRACFLDGQFVDLDSKLKPIRIDMMPSGVFDRARLPSLEEAWVRTWPPDSMKDSPAPRE